MMYLLWITSAISPHNDKRNESCYKSHNSSIRFVPKFYFILGIIFNLCLLAFFKYTDFLLENFNAFSKLANLDFDIPLPHILLPLALSFVTFQQIAFLFDCYKRTKGELNENLHIDFVDYALFISFFPQLIAGPIVHHREMMPQFAKMGNSSLGMQFRTCEKFWESTDSSLVLSQNFSQTQKPYRKYFDCDSLCESATNQTQNKNNPSLRGKAIDSPKQSTINYEFLAKGIFIFSIGLFKKVFIADSFAKWANAGFSVVESGGVLNIAESWATSLSYTFQLYFDFSGYCDMAMGLALMFGIVLPLNFDSPYKSLNITEFWRRWHITLGRFLRECLYIPLGGNRVSKILNLRNLFIVAFLSGIWHGAGWGFVIWGVLHGVAMVIHRIYSWWLANSACSDFLGSASAHSLQRTPSASHSFASHNPKNSSTILEFASYNKITKSIKSKFLHFTQTRFYKILCWFITFNFINIAWIFFHAENLNGALNLIKGMFGVVWIDLPQKWHRMSETLAQIGGRNDTIFYIVIAFIVCLTLKNSFEMLKNFDTQYLRFRFSLRIFSKKIYLKGGAVWTRFVLTIALFYIAIWAMLSNILDSNAYTPFLYFNF